MRVMIVEDNTIFAEGLKLLLTTSGREVVAVLGDSEKLVEAVDQQKPDLVIADVRLPPTYRDEGLRAAVEARRVHHDLPMMVFSQYVEEIYAAELFTGGARGVGYLLKDRVARVDEFLEALDRVADGGTVIDPEVVGQMLTRKEDPLSRLTPREREVLALMAEGLGNGEIAGRLVVSEGAVHKHIGRIFTKLDLADDAVGHRRVLAVLAYLGR
ncbi:DNA-binding NarL/FixJ family response regulator [Lipingzhangella halophila]|uniref:DNA-binding NarL/FixJ family response regulator n=1 Tax=Lipingzhangella halophila TaxID=1783352 RepID=A0A7W7RNW8_9ACTN|nr:response regulator transcription factor [Lipingzhangella halophila]MBB4935182.1 DNA-binding NarL/FixJ family response regulator [Lipingzhangella halophila]